jgi:hypothetical protein
MKHVKTIFKEKLAAREQTHAWGIQAKLNVIHNVSSFKSHRKGFASIFKISLRDLFFSQFCLKTTCI